MLVVDAANVIGSRPTGWWRDRPAAAHRFVAQVRAAVASGRLDPPVTVVLEGRARAGVEEGRAEDVVVVHAPASGDDAIAALAERDEDRTIVVVTADRELRRRVRAVGGDVRGPSWLLDRLA